MQNLSAYFLPYQVAWLNDRSPIKIWEKTRRAGASYVQAYEDVYDCTSKTVPAVFYSSSDEDAGKEYIDYCAHWAKALNIAAQYLGEELLDPENDVTAHTLVLFGDRKIHALSSNPRRFRSKGGKVVLDEFAHHDNQKQLWKAARPVITWGYPLRILSTHNGIDSLFNQFITAIKKGKLAWSLHRTDIFQAVEQGLLDKILGRKTTKKEREAWLENERANCFDETTWLEEYCCEPVDEATALISYDLITACEKEGLLMDLADCKGDLYLGMDIGRRKHLSIIWVLERLGIVKYTRSVIRLDKAPFRVQRETLYDVCKLRNFRRGCIDETGLGMQLAEEAQEKFGKYRIEPVTMTGAAKEEIGFEFLRDFEDHGILIPPDPVIRKDIHSIRKLTTRSGIVRLDAVANEEDPYSHADYFWGGALANHAAGQYKGPVTITSRRRRESNDILKGYWNG